MVLFPYLTLGCILQGVQITVRIYSKQKKNLESRVSFLFIVN